MQAWFRQKDRSAHQAGLPAAGGKVITVEVGGAARVLRRATLCSFILAGAGSILRSGAMTGCGGAGLIQTVSDSTRLSAAGLKTGVVKR
ncbi:hypothetical protein GJA_5480 [Janthinobacterium agaricidamnosum NBRC 102515 = DSM 9628]|uniref:Uncharacterized protein n=1 Tax=Janthinobacterium agaricidamnosum NBRC 102515 = DSM 9628 TaxID=1349767 RepID=W0VDS5_9BURK|nr:hypothetical protein GJA_5480 [Janthinobacterium agaricidamnosum NBRC 102515 = DSM 9628]